MSGVPYASTIGSIMHDVIFTRLDVSYELSVCRWYQSDPGVAHYVAVKIFLSLSDRQRAYTSSMEDMRSLL